MYKNAQALIHGFYHQLINGCESVDCMNPFCKCGKDFAENIQNPAQAVLRAIELSHDYVSGSQQASNRLCSGIPPVILHPEIKDQVQQMMTVLISFFHNPVDQFDESSSQIINNFFSTDLAFPYLFSTGFSFTKQDFKFDESLQDFLVAVENHPLAFVPFKESFENMVCKFLNRSGPNTLFHIRGIFLLFLITPFFFQENINYLFDHILDHIQNLSKTSQELLRNLFSQYPVVISNAISICQNNLSMYVACYNSSSTHSSHDRICIDLSNFLHQLQLSNRQILHPITADKFYNEVLAEWLDPEEELNLYLNKKPSYLDIPTVLPLKFKFEIICHYNQDQMFHITLRDIFLNQIRFNLTVNRQRIVEDTIRQIERADIRNLRKQLQVTFQGEQGVDAGGVSREFFYLLTQEIFSPDYGMFVQLPDQRYWFSGLNYIELHYYAALGKILGLAIYNSIILPIRFPNVFYKKLMGVPTRLEDLSDIDEELANSLISIRDDPSSIDGAGLVFSIEEEVMGQIVNHDLKPNGENIEVTPENANEYVDLYWNYLLNQKIEKHFDRFQGGFWAVCDKAIFQKLLTFDEIDTLVSGEAIFDWDELKENTHYADGYTAESQQVKWFWEIFDSLSQKQKENFLRFSTGTDRAPVGGLANVKLIIQKTNDISKLPVSHTCFNIFALPAYPDKETMRTKVELALEHTEGFGLI